MKPKLTSLAVSVLIIGGLAAMGAARGADTPSMPPVHVQGSASYVTGGIGEDESAMFRHEAAAYPLELLFAQRAHPKAEFLSDVKVTIRNGTGEVVLDAMAEGPFLLAKLPPGKYRIEADFGGEPKRQAVEIRPGKHQRAVFVWAARDQAPS